MNVRHSYDRPAVGDIIQNGNHAYRVIDIRSAAAEPDHYELIFVQLTGKNPDPEQHLGSVIEGRPLFRHLGEHFEVCNKCFELTPCTEVRSQRQARREMLQLEKALKVPDGACPACSEPITHRQKTLVFPGPNLLNPFGAPDVVFHSRQKCRTAAANYEDKWVEAESGRERSLLTLKCKGHLIVHTNGTAQCDRNVLCPHVHAQHSRYSACYVHDGQCPICPTFEGHPGTSPAHDLLPDGTRKDLFS